MNWGHDYEVKPQNCRGRRRGHVAGLFKVDRSALYGKRRSPKEYFTISSTVGGEFAAEACSNPDSTAASKIFASQKIPARDGYTVVSLK